jgi:LPS export ABC transporter permease LptF
VVCACIPRLVPAKLRAVRLLDRYIGRQLFITALFAVAVLSVVLVLGNIFKQLLELVVNRNAPPSLIITFIGYVIPFSLTFTLPWGFLTSILLVFGRLSAENELTAMRTSGLSIPRICLPVALLSVLFASVCLWINLDVAPRAQESMKNAIFNIATSNPLSIFGSDRVISEFPGQKIYVERTEGNNLYNLHVYRTDEDGNLVSVTFARQGTLTIEPKKQVKPDGNVEQELQIILRYSDGRFEQRDEKHPDELARWYAGVVVQKGSAEISLKELYEKKKKVGGVGTLGIEQLLKNEKPEATTELNKRVSNALATIAFALLGIPLAITAQRKETSVGFAISLVIGLIYYLFFFLADMARGRPKLHPELLVWLPNIVFLAIGAFRFYRLSRR